MSLSMLILYILDMCVKIPLLIILLLFPRIVDCNIVRPPHAFGAKMFQTLIDMPLQLSASHCYSFQQTWNTLILLVYQCCWFGMSVLRFTNLTNLTVPLNKKKNFCHRRNYLTSLTLAPGEGRPTYAHCLVCQSSCDKCRDREDGGIRRKVF